MRGQIIEAKILNSENPIKAAEEYRFKYSERSYPREQKASLENLITRLEAPVKGAFRERIKRLQVRSYDIRTGEATFREIQEQGIKLRNQILETTGLTGETKWGLVILLSDVMNDAKDFAAPIGRTPDEREISALLDALTNDIGIYVCGPRTNRDELIVFDLRAHEIWQLIQRMPNDIYKETFRDRLVEIDAQIKQIKKGDN